VWLDGARVLPTATKTGYTLSVRGKGKHKVDLKFRVPVTGPGEGVNATGIRQVRFTVPPLVQNRLVFRGPAGISSLQAPSREGSSKVTADNKGTTLDVDLGAVTKPVVLRWYQQNNNKPQVANVL